MQKQYDLINNYILAPFIKAWNLFFNVPFPVSNNYSQINLANVPDRHILYLTPIVGFAIGLVAYIFISIINLLLGTLIASVLCPFVIIIFWEYLNHGKNTNNLVHYISSALFNSSESYSDSTSEKKEINYMFFYIFTAIFVLRVLIIGLLIYFARSNWIIVAPLLAYALQGFLAKSDSEFIDFNDTQMHIILWGITGIICILFGLNLIFTAIIALLLTLIIAYKSHSMLKNKAILNKINIGILGKAMEICMLLLGLLFLYR